MKNRSSSYLAGARGARTKLILLAFLSACAMGWFSTPVCGATRTYIGFHGDLFWSNAGNWNPAGTPQDGDTLIFGAAGAPPTAYNDLTNLRVHAIQISDSAITLQGNPFLLETGIECSQHFNSEIDNDIQFTAPAGGFVRLAGTDTGNLDMHGNVTLVNTQQFSLVLNPYFLNPSQGGSLRFYGVIQGSGSVAKTGDGPLYLLGASPNTYTGGTYFQQGNIHLQKAANVASVPAPGPLRLGVDGVSQATVFCDAPGQLDTAILIPTEINDSHLKLNSYDATLGSLTMRKGATVEGAGTLKLRGDLLAMPLNTASTCVISCPLDLGSNPRRIDVRPAGLGFGFLDINRIVRADTELTITGGGFLQLLGNNSYDGLTLIEGSTYVYLFDPHGLGNPASTTYVEDGAILDFQFAPGVTNIDEPIFLSGGELTAGHPASLNGSLTIEGNSFIANAAITINGTVSGGGNLVSDDSSILLAGAAPNTFNGVWTVNRSTLGLAKANNVAAIPGTIIIQDDGQLGFLVGGILTNLQDNGVGTVIVGDDGLWLLNGHSVSAKQLGFEGTNAVVDTGSGTLQLGAVQTTNQLYAAPSASGQIIGTLALLSPTNEITAQSKATLTIPAQIIAVGTIRKEGAGTVVLGGNNLFNTPVLVEAGILLANSDTALGSSSAGTVVRDGASLELDGLTQIFAEPLHLSGAGRGGTNGALYCRQGGVISSAITLDAPATIRCDDTGSQFLLLSTITGTGPLTKTGPGILNLGGSSANSYTGDTLVNDGALWLSKPQFVIAAPGNLMLGPAPLGSTALALFFQTGEMGGDTVTVNANSILSLNNNNLNLARLNLNDGGDVQTGSGLLGLSAGGIVAVGSQSIFGSRASSSISGKIGLPDVGAVTFIVGLYGSFLPIPTAPELDVPAIISEPLSALFNGLIKDGPGQMRLGGNNTFPGQVVVSAGILIAGNAAALGTSAGTTAVNNDATLALDGGININNETLLLNSSNSPALDSRSGSNTWSGPITLSRDSRINVSPVNGYLQVLGAVNGAGGLTKIGPGTLQFRGSTSNSYAGLTVVSSGVVEGGRVNRISIPGDVVIGDDSTTSNTATLRSLREQQLRPTANVNVRSSGLLDLFFLNGIPPPNQQLRTLTGHGPVHVDNFSTLTISNDVPFDFYGAFNAPLGQPFTKLGSALMRAWGNWNCPNGISINAGDFWFNGTAQSADAMSGGRLRGDGHFTVAAAAEPGGFIGVDSMFPDHQGGDLEIADLELNAGATVEMDLFGPTPTGGNDRFTVQAAFLRSASLFVNFNYPPREGDVITLINKTSAGAISGTFTGWPAGLKKVGNVPVLVSYTGGDGNDLTLTVTNLALASVGYRLAEGNGNQTVEPDECNLLFLTLVNRRTNALTITNAFLRATSAVGVLVTIAQATFPMIPVGQALENLTPFQFRTDTNLVCGGGISFELVVGVTGEGEFAIPFSPVSGNDCTHPTGPCESCTVVSGQFTNNTPTVPQPLYLVGGPSIPYPSKACPGVDPGTNLIPVRYLTHSFTNSTTNEACVTAQLDFNCPGAPTNALGAAAYLGSFDPTQPCAGYLGDLGAGGPPYPPFAFRVAAGSNLVVVVTARATNLVCNSYTLELFGLPCPPPILAIAPETTLAKVRVHWSTAYPGFTAQQAGKLGNTFSNLALAPAIVGGRYALTNIAAATNQFYRLKK